MIIKFQFLWLKLNVLNHGKCVVSFYAYFGTFDKIQ